MRAGSWAFVALPPGQWPATAEEKAVVEAAVGFERSATPTHAAQAALAYRNACSALSDSLSLRMGLGNVLYAAGDRNGAALPSSRRPSATRQRAGLDEDLASTRAGLGRRDAALVTDAPRGGQRRAAWAERAAALLRFAGSSGEGFVGAEDSAAGRPGGSPSITRPMRTRFRAGDSQALHLAHAKPDRGCLPPARSAAGRR